MENNSVTFRFLLRFWLPPEFSHDFVIPANKDDKKNYRDKNKWGQPEELVETRAINAVHPLKEKQDKCNAKNAAKCPDDRRWQVERKRECPEQIGSQKNNGDENEKPEICI